VSAGTAYEKEIPDFILNSKRKIVVATLQGMFDGDGHAHKERGTVIYSSVSMKLIRSLQQLLLRFGIVSRTYETASQFGKGLRLDIDGADAELFYEEIGFRLERKQRMRRVLRRRKRIFKDDAVPFQGSRVKRVCYQGKRGQGMPTKYGANPASAYISKFRSSWRVRRGRKGGKISYEKIRELLEIRSDLQGTKDYDFLSMLLDMRYYWAEVVSLQ
jgi:intein/homing endonuclease